MSAIELQVIVREMHRRRRGMWR